MGNNRLQWRRIMVPLTSTPPHERILDQAKETARIFNSDLLLVYKNIYDKSDFRQKLLWLMAEDEDANRPADRRGEVEPAFSPSVTHHHLDGIQVASELLSFSVEQEIDLILLETHGHQTLGKTVFGGVAEEVVRWAKCPVLTVRKNQPVGGDIGFSKILVVTDFSDPISALLQVGAGLAHSFGAEIHCLNVVEQRARPRLLPQKKEFEIGTLHYDKTVAKIKSSLAVFQDELDGPTSTWINHVRLGHVSAQILDFIESEGIDLVLVSSHGLTNNTAFTLGSVAEKLLRRASCSVLLFKTRQLLNKPE